MSDFHQHELRLWKQPVGGTDGQVAQAGDRPRRASGRPDETGNLGTVKSNAIQPVRILAPESEWAKAREWDELAHSVASLHYGTPRYKTYRKPRVLVLDDLWERFEGAYRYEDGLLALTCAACGHIENTGRDDCLKCGANCQFKQTEHADVRARFFRECVDGCQYLEWVCRTSHPELVRDRTWEGDISTTPMKRENLTLAINIRTQAEADERIPAALALKDLVGKVYVWAEPSEEIDLSQALPEFPYIGSMDYEQLSKTIDGVIISGKRMTQTQVDSLPSGSRVLVNWQGGNACEYETQNRHGKSWIGSDCLDFVGSQRFHQNVHLSPQTLIDQCEAAGVEHWVREETP